MATPGRGAARPLTAAEWAEQHLRRPDARLFFPLFLGEMMAADPAEVSMLHVAFYLRSGGGISYLNDFEGGAQDSRVDGGAHRVCELLAERPPVRQRPARRARPRGPGRWQTASRVRTGRDDVRRGRRHRRPPARCSPMRSPIDPAPVPARARPARTGRGCAVKVHLVYPEPSWRRARPVRLVGQRRGAAAVDRRRHAVPRRRVGVLTGFVTGAEAHRFAALPPAEQRAAATAQAARIFPDLPAPDRGSRHRLGQRGVLAAAATPRVFGPGDWTRLGPHLSRPHGRIHWAGTETSTEFFGLMEGAVRSGRRAAAEVLASHRTPSSTTT